MSEIKVLSATGVLGSGFREETLKRAMALRPDFIGADSGSTDPGPYYLGSGENLFSDSACKRDLRLMLLAGRAARIPVIVGSACTGGADAQLESLARIAREIAREEKLSFKLATIAAEQDKGYLKQKLREGRIRPLANAPVFDEAVIDRSAHIVGMCGTEPYIEALQNGADVILAGRSSDTSIFAALPVMKGFNPATVWHMAKILECGAACVVQRKYPDCMFATVTDDYFVVEPPNPEYRCDPVSVASHNLYENSTPYELVEPSGVLNTVNAKYEAISDRAVRVSGSMVSLLAGPRRPGTAPGGRVCSKTVLPLSSNGLKMRVLLSSGEFHSGSKRATRGAREQGGAGGVRTDAVAVGSQFEV